MTIADFKFEISSLRLLIAMVSLGLLSLSAWAVDAPKSAPVATPWSFTPPRRPIVKAGDGWGGNAVDSFILQKLKQQGLAPSPGEQPEVLLRRLYLDLIGLP